MDEFLKELKSWGIKTYLEFGRLVLYDGDKTAREHYSNVLLQEPELEIQLILELVRSDSDIREQIEERAAIRYAEGLPDDLESAVRCNFCNST